MKNTPQVKLAIVAVSRNCFPIEVSKRRLAALMAECEKLKLDAFACGTIIETENDALAALDEARKGGANAAVVYLGNFGPEAPLSIFAEKFDGPVMVCAAAEESGGDLIGGRGDALCGMLNAAYNFGLRNVRVHTPEQPVGLPNELAARIARLRAGRPSGLRTYGTSRFSRSARGRRTFSPATRRSRRSTTSASR